MQKSTSPRPKSFKLVAIVSAAFVGMAAAAAFISGVTPVKAANIAAQPDTQVAVFMVPLTILVVAMLVEAARVALRGVMPGEAPARRQTRRYWSPGRGEG